MRINIKVIPNASRNEIIELSAGQFRVKLCAPAVEGKANKALIEFLAEYFKVKKNKIVILRGQKCRNKAVEILGL